MCGVAAYVLVQCLAPRSSAGRIKPDIIEFMSSLMNSIYATYNDPCAKCGLWNVGGRYVGQELSCRRGIGRARGSASFQLTKSFQNPPYASKRRLKGQHASTRLRK